MQIESVIIIIFIGLISSRLISELGIFLDLPSWNWGEFYTPVRLICRQIRYFALFEFFTSMIAGDLSLKSETQQVS